MTDLHDAGQLSRSDRLRRLLVEPAAATPDDRGTATPPPGAPGQRPGADAERLVGLVAAPWAAGIAIVVCAALLAHDPGARLATGALDPRHVSQSYYYGVLAVMVALSVGMLVAAWYRKGLFVGIAMALYGLALFNLRYWGFAVPFLLGAGWLLVRGYRAWHDDHAERAGPTTVTPSASPRASRRYTPPSSATRS